MSQFSVDLQFTCCLILLCNDMLAIRSTRLPRRFWIQSTLHMSMFYISISLPISMVWSVPPISLHFTECVDISLSQYLNISISRCDHVRFCSRFSIHMSICSYSQVSWVQSFWESKVIFVCWRFFLVTDCYRGFFNLVCITNLFCISISRSLDGPFNIEM